MQNYESLDKKEKNIYTIGDEVQSTDWIRGGGRDPKFNMPPGTRGKIIGKSQIHDFRVTFNYNDKLVTLEVNTDEIV